MSPQLTMDLSAAYWSKDVHLWMFISGCIPLWVSRAYQQEFHASEPTPVEPTASLVAEIIRAAERLKASRDSGVSPGIDCVCEQLLTMIALDERHCSFEVVHPALVPGRYEKTVVFYSPMCRGNVTYYKTAAVFATKPVPAFAQLQHARLIPVSNLQLAVTTNGSSISPGIPQVREVALTLQDHVCQRWTPREVDRDSADLAGYRIVDQVLEQARERAFSTIPSAADLSCQVREGTSQGIYEQFDAIIRSIYAGNPPASVYCSRIDDYRRRLYHAPAVVTEVREYMENWLSGEGPAVAHRIGDASLIRATGDPAKADQFDRRSRPRRTLVEVASFDGTTMQLRIPGWDNSQLVARPVEGEFVGIRDQLKSQVYLFAEVNYGAASADELFFRKVTVAPDLDAHTAL